MSDPKYRNVRVKKTMPSATLKSWVSSSLSYISWSRLMLLSSDSSDFLFFITFGLLNCGEHVCGCIVGCRFGWHWCGAGEILGEFVLLWSCR